MIKAYWSRFKRRFLPSLIAAAGKYGMRMLVYTCKLEVQGLPLFFEAAKNSPCILALWHNRLAAVPEVISRYAPQFNYTAFISKSRDGEPLAKIVESYPMGKVLRVPHNNRHHALSQMINLLNTRDSVLIVTPDGPRGPRYKVKPGILTAARQSGATIIPFTWVASSYWELKTWDRMLIPKPFSKITATFGPPVELQEGGTLDQDAIAVENAL